MKSANEDNYFRIPKPSKGMMPIFVGVVMFLLGLVIGIGLMTLTYQPLFQGKTAKDWAFTANENTDENIQLKHDIQVIKAQMEQLQNAPTPTPAVQYITKPSTPTTCYTYNKGKSTEFVQCQ